MLRLRMLPVLLLGLLACANPVLEPTGSGGSNTGTGTPTEIGRPIGAPTQKTIGTAGGTITTPDGKLTLTFPAGALAKETVITVQPVENKAINGIGIGYEFGPDGTRFAQPVTLTYQYSPDELLGASTEAIALASQNANRVWLLERFAKVDPARRTITGKLDHFSWWAIITLFHMTPEQAVVTPTTWIDLKIKKAADLPTIPTASDADNLPLLAPLTETMMDPFLVKDISLNGNDVWSTLQNPANPDGYLGFDHRAKEAVIRYYAPARIPAGNPVAVAAMLSLGTNAKFMLVSNLTIEYENSFSVDGKRFDDVIVAASFNTGKFMLSMLSRTDNINNTAALSAWAKLTGPGSVAFNRTENGAAAGMNAGEKQGEANYNTCKDEFTEGGSITISRVFEKNGQRYVEGTVRGSVVKTHIVDNITCGVIKHETMPISAHFLTPLQ